MYLHERMYLQPQPRVWQEMQAQATVTPPPHATSVLFSYASSGSQRRSWTRWCNGQYPGHFRGLDRQDHGSRPGSSSPLHTHSGTGHAAQHAHLGSCPPTTGEQMGQDPNPSKILTTPHPWERACSPLITAWGLMQISVQDTNRWLSWVPETALPPSGT